MYELYLQPCQEKNIENPVTESYYRRVYNTCYNLNFKKPLMYTCNTCDMLKNTIDNSLDHKILEETKIQKEVHLRKAEKARTAKDEAKSYYMRQLWTYNLGIHELESRNAVIFMWHEAEVSRGSQEIGSCLFTKQLDPSIIHLTAYNDNNCGGQNKSRFIVKFWIKTNIETVDHKFMVPGHSYMECDQDFGVNENAKKKQQYVWVPDDWVNVVAHASRKFQVVRMTSDDFKSVEPMNNLVIDKISRISEFQWIRLQKAEPYTFYYKESLNKDLAFNTLKPLYEKYKNLQELLPFIPPSHHQFYKDLPCKKQTSRKTNEVDDEPPPEDLDRL